MLPLSYSEGFYFPASLPSSTGPATSSAILFSHVFISFSICLRTYGPYPWFSSLPVPQLYSVEKPQSSLLLTCPRPLHKRVFTLCWLPHLQSASSPIFHNAKATTTLFRSKHPSASPAVPASLLEETQGVAGGPQSTVTSSLSSAQREEVSLCLCATPIPTPLTGAAWGATCLSHDLLLSWTTANYGFLPMLHKLVVRLCSLSSTFSPTQPQQSGFSPIEPLKLLLERSFKLMET